MNKQRMEQIFLRFPGEETPTSTMRPSVTRKPKATLQVTQEEKWCKLTPLRGHNTSECLKKPKDQEKIQFITEKVVPHREIKLQGTIQGHPISLIIDTGAVSNQISSKTAKDMDLKVITGHDKTPAQLGNGTDAKIFGTATAKIKLNDFPVYTFEEKLKVIQGDLPEILFGCLFLNQQDVLIDYREKKLRIIDQVSLLSPQYEGGVLSDLDRSLIEKVRMVAQTAKTTCLERVSKIERISELLGLDPNVEMVIKLSSHEGLKRKPYLVSLKLRERTDKEIERLINAKILRTARCNNFGSPALPKEKK